MSVLTLAPPQMEVVNLQSRPWLALYGVMVKPRHYVAAHMKEEDMSPIQRLLTDELMTIIFSKLEPYTLGRAACACRQWRHLADHPHHWLVACQHAYGACHKDIDCNQQLVRKSYRGSWRKLFLECPHLRFEGLYVSRNTYIRQGVSEWKRERTCFLVTYFRYFRFFPDGTLLYRTSPLTVAKVAKSLLRNPCEAVGAKQKYEQQHVFSGRYVIKGGKVFIVIVYPNSRNTEVRARCNIRGVPLLGAANRLDLEELVSFDRDLNSSASMLQAPEEAPEGNGNMTNFKRGLSPCVFVPWEHVSSSPLNLPIKDMDFWMPG